MKKYLIIFFIALTLNVFAQQNTSYECKEDSSSPSHYFPEIQQKARQFNRLICTTLKDTASRLTVFPQDSLNAFARFVKNDVASKFKNMRIDNLQIQLNYFVRVLHEAKKFPVFNVQKSPMLGRGWLCYFTGKQDSAITISVQDDSICSDGFNGPCSEVLDDLDMAVYPYQINKNSYSAFKTRLQLTTLQKEWNDYFKNTKSQTFADIILTTLIERSLVKKDFLTGPPPRQWFILHPGVAYEYLKAAPDGNQINESFYFEWLGINWLKSPLFDLPLGLSYAGFYTDVANIKNFGQGALLTIANSYMLGYVRHGSEDGYVISVDLLKLFKNNGQYIGLFDKRLKNLLNE